jgi:hypothetical protein
MQGTSGQTFTSNFAGEEHIFASMKNVWKMPSAITGLAKPFGERGMIQKMCWGEFDG